MSEVVFYSWQSDLPNATNRGFIQQALEQAVKSIASDESLSVEPVIDRDTSGVPGSPEIARTIFNKIGRAAVFVADVSIINRAERGTGRPTPNPNVLVELGYALHALGPTRVLLVLNAAYGEPEQLPFDLRMRRTIAYCMPEKAFSRSAERKKLEKGLSVALRAIFQHKVDSTTALATTSGARGKRIGMVIQLMNEAWGYENFSVSSIADMLGMEYINELENYIDGVAEPSIPFLEHFCERFGVCPEWLKHGQLAPFTSSEQVSAPLQCLARIRVLNLEHIFFVRSRAPRGEAGIVAKIADQKYVTFEGDWPISSQVGAGGAANIYEFYRLIKELQVGEFQHHLGGRLYDANAFNHLFHGHYYPGFVERPGSYGSYWWDDFADTEVPHFSREHRERIWGQEFVLAQDIVLAVLSNRWPSRGAPQS